MHLDDVVTELVEHCGDRLLRVAYQLTHDAAAAQDLVQEALLHERLHQSHQHQRQHNPVSSGPSAGRHDPENRTQVTSAPSAARSGCGGSTGTP